MSSFLAEVLFFYLQISTHLYSMYTCPSKAEQCLHNVLKVVEALRHIGLDYDIQVSWLSHTEHNRHITHSCYVLLSKQQILVSYSDCYCIVSFLVTANRPDRTEPDHNSPVMHSSVSAAASLLATRNCCIWRSATRHCNKTCKFVFIVKWYTWTLFHTV